MQLSFHVDVWLHIITLPRKISVPKWRGTELSGLSDTVELWSRDTIQLLVTHKNRHCEKICPTNIFNSVSWNRTRAFTERSLCLVAIRPDVILLRCLTFSRHNALYVLFPLSKPFSLSIINHKRSWLKLWPRWTRVALRICALLSRTGFSGVTTTCRTVG